ncbi:MAG TPA: twin-arginine translocation signal domain-containing protein [Planctomycetes bacterium]|nr:twin-arginine translocation signal domain-containing protein [Planctomycetota bacterium]
MAEIFYKSINRRDFIKTSLAAVGVMVTVGSPSVFGSGKNGKEAARWAFLADTHIPEDVSDKYRGFYPYRNLQKVIPQIISVLPDGVAIAGDLARLEGKLGDYANLKKLLSPAAEKTPVFMALGNHDHRNNFRKVFNKIEGERQPASGKHVVVVNKPPIRLIILDSLFYVNKVPGLLGRAQRRWLQDYLKNCDDTPTMLCFHHTLGDGDGDLLDVPRLFDIIKPIRKVKAVLYGHSHEYGFSEFEGIHLVNLPAVGYNFSDTEPVGWVEARLTAKGGDFTLHVAAGNKEKDGSVKKLAWRR